MTAGHQGDFARATAGPVRAAHAVVMVTAATLTMAGLGTSGAVAQQSARATAAPALVFDGATVVDVDRGKLVANQRVVITGNYIQVVDSAAAVKLPQGAQVVAARGKYLIPGLWDMHFHTRTALAYPLLLANGVTGIRDAWSPIPLDTMVQWRREILAGSRVGPPRQLLAGLTFGQDGHYSIDPADVDRIVDSLKAHGANFLKVYPLVFTVAAASRRAGLPFGGHVVGEDAADASDSGMRIIDHLNTSGGLDTLCIASSQRSVARCQSVAERFRRNGTWFVPTVATLAPGITAYSESPYPVFVTPRTQQLASSLPDHVETFWDSTPPGGRSWLRDLPNQAELTSGSPPDTLNDLRLMQKVGLPLLAGSDLFSLNLGISPAHAPGFSLQFELAMLVADGLTPLNALRAATLNPAKMLNATDSLGTVAPGKLADLVLLDANPLADITNTTAIRAVVANGRYFDRAALDELLTDARARVKQGFMEFH